MEGREGMSLSGSPSYYLSRGVSGSGHNPGSFHGSGTQPGIPIQPGFRSITNPNISIQTNVRESNVGSSYQFENPSPNFGHGINMGMASGSGVSSGGTPAKKKRGRPRKYGPDGSNMSLALSPMSSNPSSGPITTVESKHRGRPRGSGRKQRLASLGEWMNSSAGMAFTPHVIHIAAGEDIASKILSFARQRPRALCVLSANGSVSAVALRQCSSSGGTVTYEGRFEILCLSGSYLLSEEGGSRDRTGGLSISVCTHDGFVLGGAIGGRLIAASLVQAIVGSFVYGGTKPKNNSEADANAGQTSEVQPTEKSTTPVNTAQSQNLAPLSGMAVWPPSTRPDSRDPKTEIDLARG